MTSNIGAKKLTEKAAPIGFATSTDEQLKATEDFEAMKLEILKDLKDHFRPEFLNRIDKVVVFRALTNSDIKKIVKLHLGYLEKRLEQKQIKLQVSPGALDVLSLASYDPKYGARPVRRAIQELIEDPLTFKFFNGDFKEGDEIKVLKKNKELDLVKA